MFYCEPCRVRNGWPLTLGIKSEGPCEECEQLTTCHDVPAYLVTDELAYAAKEALLRALPLGGEVLDAIRSDQPASVMEPLLYEFAKRNPPQG